MITKSLHQLGENLCLDSISNQAPQQLVGRSSHGWQKNSKTEKQRSSPIAFACRNISNRSLYSVKSSFSTSNGAIDPTIWVLVAIVIIVFSQCTCCSIIVHCSLRLLNFCWILFEISADATVSNPLISYQSLLKHISKVIYCIILSFPHTISPIVMYWIRLATFSSSFADLAWTQIFNSLTPEIVQENILHEKCTFIAHS